MKLAAFYENILEGADAESRKVSEVVRELMGLGMEKIYLSSWTIQDRSEELREVLTETGVAVEGIYGLTWATTPRTQGYNP